MDLVVTCLRLILISSEEYWCFGIYDELMMGYGFDLWVVTLLK